jgi:hypothetical protein
VFVDTGNLDTMKKVAQLYLASLCKSAMLIGKGEQQVKGSSNSMYLLTVIIERARHLPQMGNGNLAEVFCVIFVEGAPGLFQTETLQRKSEPDWTWGNSASFYWKLGPAVRANESEHKVVIIIYGKDQISSCNVIGCVAVQLRELQHGHLDEWREIIRPQRQFFKKRLGSEKAELKLKISLQPGKDSSGEHSSKVPKSSSLTRTANGSHSAGKATPGLSLSTLPKPSSAFVSATLVFGPPRDGANVNPPS